MTKQVRIENADTSNYKVSVEVWDKGNLGEEDRLVKTMELSYPTAMMQEYIHSTRYIVIRELSYA